MLLSSFFFFLLVKIKMLHNDHSKIRKYEYSKRKQNQITCNSINLEITINISVYILLYTFACINTQTLLFIAMGHYIYFTKMES